MGNIVEALVIGIHDKSLFQHELIFVAAGNPKSMLAIPPKTLQNLSEATVADISED